MIEKVAAVYLDPGGPGPSWASRGPRWIEDSIVENQQESLQDFSGNVRALNPTFGQAATRLRAPCSWQDSHLKLGKLRNSGSLTIDRVHSTGQFKVST